jgi:hypothetical protein
MHRTNGTVLLFMIGLMTVMLVLAFAYVSTIQVAHDTSQFQRQKMLARLAADMGMQHAIAVCMHEYTMTSEVSDGNVGPAHTAIDSPHKHVFAPLSPRIGMGESVQQPPLPWDLAPDVSFQDLMWGYFGSYHSVDNCNLHWVDGWTMNLGYARLIEANRFNYQANTVYDPSTYDAYDVSSLSTSPSILPDPGLVSTPFPPVDPFIPGRSIATRHELDHPLWLDANYRPVGNLDDPARGAVEARYRLRYAVYVEDMSPALWLNTDMPWVPEASKSQIRTSYGATIASIGAAFGRSIIEYGDSMASIFRGYGQYGNVGFDPSVALGVPVDWPDRGSVPMYYRSSSANPRAIYNVHGGPFAAWNDPDPSDATKRLWIGSALSSWNDLTFALQGPETSWHLSGDTRSYVSTYYGVGASVRADPVGQHVVTPFGRPYMTATDNPWAVNALNIPMKVIEGMVAAYLPPAVRSTWLAKGGSGVYDIDAGVEPGKGVDLFTDVFASGGRHPFAAYPAPMDRDYWTSSARTGATIPADLRTNAQRYPGLQFFSDPTKETSGGGKALCPTLWENLTADPRQTGDDSNFSFAYDPYSSPGYIMVGNIKGADNLARHITFYDPSAAPAVRSNTGILSYKYRTSIQKSRVTPETLPMDPSFTPMQPFGLEGYNFQGSMQTACNGNAWERGGSGGCGFSFTGHEFHLRGVLQYAASNSYWNRLALAYVHAVVVGQIANMAWASPDDARNQSYWPINSVNDMPAGIVYTSTPSVPVTLAKRKGPANGWNPAAAHFADEEMLDRQFLANLGESFDQPGRMTPGQALAAIDPRTGVPRPPRYNMCNFKHHDASARPRSSSFVAGAWLQVGEYRITNNIRTLLTPIDTTSGVSLTASSADSQVGLNAPPRKLWLLDEWDVGNAADYDPGVSVGAYPTPLARARAKLMERVLNDWRMSFLGSVKAYAPDFRPKDFDGDGIVFCSGYLDATGGADAETALTCWQVADGNGNGPGIGAQPTDPAYGTASKQLTLFSVTGCMGFQRSHQYKIRVRGELFDNNINSAVSEQYLESAIIIDPDNNVSRGASPTGLVDSTVMMMRPIHNYYRGYLSRSYP